jgi:hypothetical protein
MDILNIIVNIKFYNFSTNTGLKSGVLDILENIPPLHWGREKYRPVSLGGKYEPMIREKDKRLKVKGKKKVER